MRALLLLCLLGAGCWDFEALSRGYQRPDEGGPADLNGGDLICQGTALVENCSDGSDNDGDCDIDCADSECAQKDVCQPIAGLIAYGELTRGAGVCRPGTGLFGPANLYDRIDPTAIACSGCTCSTPGASCFTELRFYSKNGCKAADLVAPRVALPGAMQCIPLDIALKTTASAIFDAPKPCVANATAARPNEAFASVGRLCLNDGALKTCTTPSCVLAQMTRDQRACIAISGTECPMPFRAKETWNQKYTDPRTCSCTCASPDGSCESTAVTVVANDCSGTNKIPLTAGACKDLTGGFMPAAVDYLSKPKAGAMCTPSGTAQGTATVSDPLTICCLPAS